MDENVTWPTGGQGPGKWSQVVSHAVGDARAPSKRVCTPLHLHAGPRHLVLAPFSRRASPHTLLLARAELEQIPAEIQGHPPDSAVQTGQEGDPRSVRGRSGPAIPPHRSGNSRQQAGDNSTPTGRERQRGQTQTFCIAQLHSLLDLDPPVS